jgi:hypothetical protein
MNPTEMGLFNQAIATAQAGQREAAYTQLVALAQTNPQNVLLLLWIAHTTPDLMEARRVLDYVGVLDPQNPALAAANAYWMNWQATVIYKDPRMPVWVKVVSAFILIQLVVAIITLVVLVIIGPETSSTFSSRVTKPTQTTCPTCYEVYDDPDSMRSAATIGTRVKFVAADLKPMQVYSSEYNYYLWQSKADVTNDAGVILEFSKTDKLKPFSSSTTYFGRVTNLTANKVANNAYLYVKIDYVAEGIH